MELRDFENMKIISRYTREEAIQDGVLFDVSNTAEAKEAGFKIPVCITASVQALCEVPEELQGLQDYSGRLWDTLYIAALVFKRHRARGSDCRIVPFEVGYQMSKDKIIVEKLWLVFNEHEGFTIMKPEDY